VGQKAETKQMEMEIGRKYDGNHDGIPVRGSNKSTSRAEYRGMDLEKIFL
jgi:hypothetical protein